MQHRRTILAAAGTIALVFAAGILAAQTLEDAAVQTLSKDAVIQVQTTTLKQDVKKHDAEMKQAIEADKQAQLEFQRGGGHGGHGGGGFHPGPRPGPRPGPHPGPRPGPHPGPRPFPGHGNWNRWPGHPGWGYGRGWEFRDGRWWWPGWVIWRGFGRAACVAWYDNGYGSCSNACADSNASCVESCSSYGDPNCAAACNAETSSCESDCGWRRDQLFLTCPAF